MMQSEINDKYQMTNKRHIVFFLFLLLTPHFLEASTVDISAESAIVVDAKNGQVLYEKNIYRKLPPASTAKLMTAIVALENLSLNTEIIPSKNLHRVQPTIVGLKQNVKYRLKDLLAALVINSANDAAIAISEAVARNEKEFVKLMNEKASDIGMSSTYFATSSGLPVGKKDVQYTTAKDLAIMMRYALKYNIILEMMSRKEMYIYGSDNKRIYLKTHNHALLRYDKAPWGKTGYTKAAKRTFVGVDPSTNPKIVIGLLRSNDLWDDLLMLNSQGLKLYRKKHLGFIADVIDWLFSR